MCGIKDVGQKTQTRRMLLMCLLEDRHAAITNTPIKAAYK